MNHGVEKLDIQLNEKSIDILKDYIASIEDDTSSEVREKLRNRLQQLKERGQKLELIDKSQYN